MLGEPDWGMRSLAIFHGDSFGSNYYERIYVKENSWDFCHQKCISPSCGFDSLHLFGPSKWFFL